jgi:uncharacterized membrane protein YgdD (TMEM256/DUF423 family)
MNDRSSIIAGIVFAGLGVIIGAFGAHALKELLIKTGRAETFELAVRYQFYHALALIITGIMGRVFAQSVTWAAFSFIAGILLFSGSLYVLSLTGITMLGAVTPFGGVFFIIGWISLLLGMIKKTG